MFALHENLYHYTKFSTAIDHILRTMTLKMGSLSAVNDPRESKTWLFTLYAREPESAKAFGSGVFEEYQSSLRKKLLFSALLGMTLCRTMPQMIAH